MLSWGRWRGDVESGGALKLSYLEALRLVSFLDPDLCEFRD